MPDAPCLNAQLTLTNAQGLHARAAAAFVRALSGFSAQVLVSWDGRTVNGRSILDLMTLGAPQGSVLEVQVRGADAREALDALTRVVEARFYEE
jgi:phosphocarrier protein